MFPSKYPFAHKGPNEIEIVARWNFFENLSGNFLPILKMKSSPFFIHLFQFSNQHNDFQRTEAVRSHRYCNSTHGAAKKPQLADEGKSYFIRGQKLSLEDHSYDFHGTSCGKTFCSWSSRQGKSVHQNYSCTRNNSYLQLPMVFPVLENLETVMSLLAGM